MTLSSNSAQTREIGELRNQLKWMDEERRKAGRKLTELEQRLAQQGRDVAERDRRIQELEWHINSVAERLERVPEEDPKLAAQEQRVQDLEWHVSNISTQLSRQPNPDEERARLSEEVNRILAGVQQQWQAEVAELRETNSRLMLQLQAAQESSPWQLRMEERLEPMAERQEEQAQVLDQVNERYAGLRQSVDALSAQLHERTATLAAEAQTHYAALANRVQEYLDAQAEQLATRTAAVEATWQERLDTVVGRAPELVTLSAQYEQLDQALADMGAQVAALQAQTLDASESSDSLVARLARVEDALPHMGAQVAALQSQTLDASEDSESLVARLARVEDALAHMGNTRELLALFDRLEQELELRQIEDARLAELIGQQEGRFAPVAAWLDETRDSSANLVDRMAEVERSIEEAQRNTQDFNDNWKPLLTEVSRRMSPMTERMTALNNSILKAEASLQALNSDQSEMRETLTTLADESQRTRAETARQLDAWQGTMDEQKETIERFTQQWLTLSNQYKEARMAVQNFAHWQKQLEQQKREASEMLRIESNRMQSRWDGFLLEVQEKLKNFELELSQKWQAFEMENEQRWVGARRNEQVWREELAGVDELIQKLQQDNRTLIWRVQAAQADAIKKWPRLLMEEVEKAVELNPNRRLSPSTATTRADLSVVDAIEQGLITIDYDDSAPEL